MSNLELWSLIGVRLNEVQFGLKFASRFDCDGGDWVDDDFSHCKIDAIFSGADTRPLCWSSLKDHFLYFSQLELTMVEDSGSSFCWFRRCASKTSMASHTFWLRKSASISFPSLMDCKIKNVHLLLKSEEGFCKSHFLSLMLNLMLSSAFNQIIHIICCYASAGLPPGI